MRNPIHILADVLPMSRPLEKKKVWLLEWMEAWRAGRGEEFKRRAFSTEKAAVKAGQDMLERRLFQKQEPGYYIERMKQALEQTNSQGNHYCLGIFIEPLELEGADDGQGPRDGHGEVR